MGLAGKKEVVRRGREVKQPIEEVMFYENRPFSPNFASQMLGDTYPATGGDIACVLLVEPWRKLLGARNEALLQRTVKEDLTAQKMRIVRGR